MTPEGWNKLGFVLASGAYWIVALVFWFLLAVSYGDCGLVPAGTQEAINACQNEKVLVVWGMLGLLIAVYAAGILIARKLQKH